MRLIIMTVMPTEAPYSPANSSAISSRTAPPPQSPPDERLAQLAEWLPRQLSQPVERLAPASADASFRRYFRAWSGGRSYVVMDAPPGKEDIAPFVRVAHLLRDCGVHAPDVLAADLAQGFALLEDLGSVHYLSQLTAGQDADALYGDALTALAAVQLRGDASSLEPYDRAVLLREMRLMPEWFCERHLQLQLTGTELDLLGATEEALLAAALAQPQVFVHRDYHSRNLMVLGERNPGVIDFQDALHGPVGYDLVSLLKDCYIEWPRARVEGWLRGYRARLMAEGGAALCGADHAEFLRWFDFIGLQRHIKVLGIFARLNWRDGKPGYLGDLPRTLGYVRDAAARYGELAEFARFVELRLVPQLAAANARALDERKG